LIALLLMAAQAAASPTPAPPPIIETAAPAPLAVTGPGATAEPVAAPPAPDTAPHGKMRHAPGDPLEGFNRAMYKLHNGLDHALFRPLAMGYKHIVPRFIRSALRHAFSNLNEPVVFANYMLQFKIGKAAETVARFTINSTAGLGGTIDVAKGKGINLPHRNNGLGDTLGYYGVKPGPYLFLPFVGPSDFRDLLGGTADGLLLPNVVGSPFNRTDYMVGKAVVTGLDLRAEHDGDLRSLLDSALDPYATLRSVYQQDRAGEIAGLHGLSADGAGAIPGGDALSDPLADPAAGGAAAAPQSGATELSDPMADPAGPAAPAGALPPSAAPLPGDAPAPAAPAGALAPSAAPLPGDEPATTPPTL